MKMERCLMSERGLRVAIDKLCDAFINHPAADGRPYDEFNLEVEKVNNLLQ